MRTKDFENAIDNLSSEIFIDEMILKNGVVQSVYAHQPNRFLKWDSIGRAYSSNSVDELPMECLETKESVKEWQRNPVFDLKFD